MKGYDQVMSAGQSARVLGAGRLPARAGMVPAAAPFPSWACALSRPRRDRLSSRPAILCSLDPGGEGVAATMTDQPGRWRSRRLRLAVLCLAVAGMAAVAAVLAEPVAVGLAAFTSVLAEPVAVGLAAFTSVLAVALAGAQLLRRPLPRRAARPVEVSLVVPAPRRGDQTVEVQLRAEPSLPAHPEQR